MVRMTPCTPCCVGCVLEAFRRAGAVMTEAFVIVSGLEQLDAKALARYVESVAGPMETRIHLVIETPAPVSDDPVDDESPDDEDESSDDATEKEEAN